MEFRNIVAGFLVVLLIAGVAVGTTYYLFKSFPGRQEIFSGNNHSSKTQPLPTPKVSFDDTNKTENNVLSINNDAGFDVYQGKGFDFSYPNSWGLLKCKTSDNIEFDPYNSSKQVIPCNFALKPITILINTADNCLGEPLQLGFYNVRKTVFPKVTINGRRYNVSYRWCFSIGNKGIEITHRVSTNNAPASSKDDFSAQIEQIITSFKFQGSGGS